MSTAPPASPTRGLPRRQEAAGQQVSGRVRSHVLPFAKTASSTTSTAASMFYESGKWDTLHSPPLVWKAALGSMTVSGWMFSTPTTLEDSPLLRALKTTLAKRRYQAVSRVGGGMILPLRLRCPTLSHNSPADKCAQMPHAWEKAGTPHLFLGGAAGILSPQAVLAHALRC